jgi:hypothetical protein
MKLANGSARSGARARPIAADRDQSGRMWRPPIPLCCERALIASPGWSFQGATDEAGETALGTASYIPAVIVIVPVTAFPAVYDKQALRLSMTHENGRGGRDATIC